MLTSNQLKSTTINGVLNVVNYGSTNALLKVDNIEPQTETLIITGPVYISYLLWSTLGNGFYDQFATGMGTYLDQFS